MGLLWLDKVHFRWQVTALEPKPWPVSGPSTFYADFPLLPGRHTALRCSYPGLHEVRRHLNTTEWMGLLQILLIPQSTARSPFGSSVAGFSASAGRCWVFRVKSTQAWEVALAFHNGHRCSGPSLGFTPFTLCQTTKTRWRQLTRLSETLQDKRDLLREATCIFLSVFPLGK